MLEAALERLVQDEAYARERLGMMVGVPSGVAVVLSLGGAATALEKGWSLWSAVAVIVAMAAMLFGAVAVRFRYAMYHFHMCRSVLSYEIARRRAEPRWWE